MANHYVLSWEEFVEVHSESLPRPSIESFICAALVALATGTFGALLIYFIQPQDRGVASLFCWLALAVLVVAFWDFKFRTDKRRKRFLRELRSIYDRYHSGEQALAFDANGWKHETQAAKYEASWEALTTAIERTNVITWSTRDHVTMLPKRAVASSYHAGNAGEKGLEQLRRLTLGPIEHGLSFRIGLVDYVLTEVPSLWRRHVFLMTEAHLGGMLLVVMIAYGMYNSAGPGVVFGWIAAGILLFVTITAQLWYFVTKYFTSPSQLRATWEAQFSDRGVRTTNSNIELFVAWSVFRKFRETRRAFLLFVNPTMYYLYPKRHLPSDKQNRLRSLLKARVAADSEVAGSKF